MKSSLRAAALPVLVVAFAAVPAACALFPPPGRGEPADPLLRTRLATDLEMRSAHGSAREAGNPAHEMWVWRNHHPIRSLVSEDTSDLAFLDGLVGDARIVQLGESGHGMAESNLLKARIVRYLHEALGFEVLAFESALYQCYRADLEAAAADPRRTLLNSLIGVWHTEEMLTLFEWIRTTRKTERPMRIAGFDIRQIGRNKAGRPAFFRNVAATVDAEFAEEAFRLDTEYLEEYAKGPSSRREFFRREKDRLIDAYRQLADFFDEHAGRIGQAVSREDLLVARQTARSIARYVRQQVADAKAYAQLRDRGMADNLRFLAEELYPGRRIVVWAHNAHVRRDNEAIAPTPEVFPGVRARSMGSWLNDWYGASLYTFGVYAGRGRATDDSRDVYEIPPPRPDSLEALLESAGRRACALDLSRARKDRSSGWVFRPLTVRYNGRHEQTLVPREQYDGVLYLDEVSPPRFLY